VDQVYQLAGGVVCAVAEKRNEAARRAQTLRTRSTGASAITNLNGCPVRGVAARDPKILCESVDLPLVVRADADSPSPASETLSVDSQGTQDRTHTPGFKTAFIAPLREDIVRAGGNLLNEKLSRWFFMGKLKEGFDNQPFRLLVAEGVGLLVLLAETRNQFRF